MKKYRGYIRTDKVGSECAYEFEVEDNASEDEIEECAREAAFDLVEWNYEQVPA